MDKASGRVLLVTGGGRGIGAATARLAASQGWAVAVNYTANSLAADEVVRGIRELGGTAITVQADVSDEAQVLAMFQKVDAKLGRLTGLVNNAGVVDVSARVDEMSLARIKRMFDINVIGSMLCAREAVRRMSTKHGGEGGAIVNVSSAASRLGSPGQYVDYAAAKGAIDAFTIGLAKEVAAEGIRVNAVRPGLSRPRSMLQVACPRGFATWSTWCPCSEAARPTRWPSPSCGCCRTRRVTPP